MTHGFSSTSVGSAALTTQDYSKYDLFLDSQGLLQWDGEGAQNSTQTLDLAPPQTDTGANSNEIPSALGRYFSQTDFSHGSQQPYFHNQSSDSAKYLHSEGFDISEPGLLQHLNAVLTGHGGAVTGGRSAQVGGKLLVAAGNNVRIYDPITGNSTTVDPHAGEAAVAVQDITAEGSRVFAALGVNGIHVSSDSGATWSHYSDAQAIRVAWLKERLIATTATNFYEITAGGAAPSPIETLAAGWTFTDLGENGPYIYAPAVTAEMSKVFHFGIDTALNLTVQGSSWLPNGELCYSVKGYLGIVFLGCGRINDVGGKDALFYKAIPDTDGFLDIRLVAEAEGAGTDDLAIRALATKGRNVLLGWTLGADSPYGVREGLAIYDPALDSFATHLASSTSTLTPESVLSCGVFEGRVYFVTEDAVYYEDTTKRVATATLISSIANWSNAGLKDWDQTAITHKALPATASVDVQYTIRSPEDGEWSAAGSSAIASSNGETFKHPGVHSQKFTVKLVSHSTQAQTNAPEIESFSTRANPTLADPEYRLIRTVKVFDEDRSGISSTKQLVRQDPHDVRTYIRNRINEWCQFYEADDTPGYTVRLVKFQELDMHSYRDADGNTRTDGFFVVLVMDGTRNS